MMQRLALILTLLCLTACGSLPAPFKGTPKATMDNPLLDMPTAVGIAVVPVRNLPQPFNAQLTDAVATGLQAFEIPAEAVPYNAGLGFTLEAVAMSHDAGGGQRDVTIEWSLRTRGGGLRGSYTQQARLSEAALAAGNVPFAQQMGAETADVLTDLIAGSAPRMTAPTARAIPAPVAAAPQVKFPTVSVKPVEGAPGDGRESLRLAVIQGLADSGVKRNDVDPDVVLTCQMTAEASGAFQQNVTIIWTATLKDGRNLGEVKIENTIPTGALGGTWGPTAFSIAGAALEDLLRLLVSAPSA